MNGKYSDWKQNAKERHREEIAARKAIKAKWKRTREDNAVLRTIQPRTEFAPFDPTPEVIAPERG